MMMLVLKIMVMIVKMVVMMKMIMTMTINDGGVTVHLLFSQMGKIPTLFFS